MSQLVAKTSSAIAVDENLTTLLDWTCIDGLSGFTIVIANAGGGSGNDITDVQIDTSADAGVTPVLDQHGGVPAVPIASGAAAQETFTETANWIRVRALCAAGEDTTATAIVLADSSTARICTLADVKDRLGITVTDYDAALTRLITGIEEIFNSQTRRTLIAPAAAVTEYYTGRGNRLQLERYPIIAITSIKESITYDFDNADALTADSGYRIVANGRSGVLLRMYLNWASQPDSVQVVYRGGYAAAGQSPGSGEYALPADLREAAIEQASFLFKRRDDIGLSSVGIQGAQISKHEPIALLKNVREILDHYRRPQL